MIFWIELPSSSYWSLSSTGQYKTRRTNITVLIHQGNKYCTCVNNGWSHWQEPPRQGSLLHKHWVSATFPVGMTRMLYSTSIQHKFILELAKELLNKVSTLSLKRLLGILNKSLALEDHCPNLISYHCMWACLSSVPYLLFCALHQVPASLSRGIRQRAKGIPRVAPWAYLQKAEWRFWRS